ncbi:pyrroline-5-carboxylate reductase family protein [Endozoicomonas euniceicola]|uniref:NAD(P)-binding domain-containing protein n=1 Tax=Endozoicomonas euniceicola TaxID=1234143 RepID=A0ABY6H167_9GAMM|nr:NAD(P)-binding domain-containing protein [Endozoicomonas euniceicola]UYM18807.1 NAD(P)-binding domain-containing protein [Endozoicomonas euniceicola]
MGAGNMACSIFGGLIEDGWPKNKIWATARSEATLEKVKNQYGVQVTPDNHQAVRQSEVVVLCVSVAAENKEQQRIPLRALKQALDSLRRSG